MDLRRDVIKAAYGSTCQWFFDSPEYINWRDNTSLAEHHGFLWVRGKPGAGKSTLMRLAVKHANQKFPQDLRMSFFFNSKGTILERSVEGMFRSLLCQLLEQSPGLDHAIKQKALNQSNWPVALLEEHFRDCVLLLRGRYLTCHIDALDECEESDVRAMIEFFEDLGCRAVSSHVWLRVCFASRHYPYISMSKCVQLVLDGHQDHLKDIRTYVHDNLRISDPALRDHLTLYTCHKAHGVFLWAVHATRLNNQDRDRGHSQSLDARLDNMPAGFTHLYEDAIFKRDANDDRYLLPMLLWLAFAQRRLSTKELYHAVMFTSEGKAGAAATNKTPNASQMERFILNTTKGLAEISPYEDKHVSFVHDTVTQYLQNDGIGRLDSSKIDNPVGLSHELLKTNCLEYILLAGQILPELLASKPDYEHQRIQCATFPLLSYMLSGVVSHAELAQAHGVSQNSFVKDFPLDLVLSLWDNAYQLDLKWGAYTPTATKTYMFALSGAPNLLHLELEGIKSRRRSRPRLSLATDPDNLAHSSDQGKWGHPLHAALSIQHFECVRLLLEHGFDPNAHGVDSTTLQTAITYSWNDMSIIRLLLDHGADPNGRTNPGKEYESTVLHAAIDDGKVEAVRVLVEYGADIHVKRADGLTALQHAMEGCPNRQPMVAYLFERELQDADSAASSPWSIVDE